MEQSSKETLVKVINLIKSGDNKTAIPMLTALLKKDPELEQAWYLLGMALDAKDKKIRAFNQVLKLNPNNEKAQKQLAKLEQPKAPTFQPPPEEPAEQPDAEPPADRTTETSQSMKTDFDLPDWMRQDNFDATDHLPSLPEDSEGMGEDSGSTPWDQEEEVEIPDWAQRSQPPPPGPVLSDEEDTPDWLRDSAEQSSGPFVEDSDIRQESAFTDYSFDDEFEDEAEEEPYQQTYETPDLGFEDDEEDFEEEEIDESEPEWLRSMVEEDESSGKKRKKKKKKKKKRPKIELSKAEKKRRRRRIFLYSLLILCIGVAGASYFFQEELQPYVEQYAEMYLPPVLTRAAPVTDLLTEGAPITDLLTQASPTNPNYLTPSPTTLMTPTLEPTWTPGGTQVATNTPRPTNRDDVTPTPSQTSAPLPQDTQGEIQIIQGQVVQERGLPGPNIVADEIISGSNLRLVVEDWMDINNTIEDLEKDQIAYLALGLVDSNYDLVVEAVNSRVDSLGGFYLPEQNKVYVVGSDFNAIQKYAYANEYAHAIQDANFDLKSLGVYPTCTLSAQACLAVNALIEGDASMTREMWFEAYPPEIGADDIRLYTPPAALFLNGDRPAFFEQNILFPYTYGVDFVSYLYENGGWNAVNRAYKVLPQTTEQILHPVKYDQREEALFIDFPDLTAIQTDGWEIIRNDSLGEWQSYLLLAYNGYPDAQQPDSEATVAAAGWGGDHYVVMYNADTGDTLLAVLWDWDTQIDSDQFYTSLTAYLAGRYNDLRLQNSGTGTCWHEDNENSCIYRQEKQILWLLSDNPEKLALAKALFTDFP